MAPRPRKDGSPVKRKTARELTTTVPGIHNYQRAIILALCHGTSVNTPNYTTTDIAVRIADVAARIIEETEQ